MRIREHRDLGASQLFLRVRLARVQNHQIWAKQDDSLHVGIDQPANSRERTDLGGLLVEAADADHLRPGTDGEEHLRHCGDHRDDAPGRILLRDGDLAERDTNQRHS